MEMLKNRRAIYRAVLLVTLLLYLWLAACIPYTHDDWEWGLPQGLRHFLAADLNSRYMGNLVEILLTRSPLLKTLVMGLVFTALPAAAAALGCFCAGLRGEEALRVKLPAFLLGNLLLLSLRLDIWRETYAWVAGFSNYVASALLLLAYHRLLLDGEEEKTGLPRLLAAYLAGVAVQLFLEDLTIYVLLCTLLALLLRRLRREAIPRSLWALLIGNVLGTALMFSSGLYGVLFHTGSAIDSYRELTFDPHAGIFAILSRLIRLFLVLFPPAIWVTSWTFSIAVLLLLACLALRRRPGRLSAWIAALNGLLTVYLVYVRFRGRIQLPSLWWSNILDAGMGLLIFLAALGELLLLFDGQPQLRRRALLFWCSAPAVTLPLAAVTYEMGTRFFLTPDIMLMETALLLLAELLRERPKRAALTALLCALGACALFVHLAPIYGGIGAAARERERLIRQTQTGESERLILPAFPGGGKYLHHPDPGEGSAYVQNFRAFYGIPEGVELRFESWEDPA